MEAEINDPSVESPELNGSPFKPGVGQSTAMPASPTARDVFLAKLYSSGPFTCIFFQRLLRVFPVLAVANTGSCVGPQNELGHLTHHYRQLMQVPVLRTHGI